jgi:hypothetical protein
VNSLYADIPNYVDDFGSQQFTGDWEEHNLNRYLPITDLISWLRYTGGAFLYGNVSSGIIIAQEFSSCRMRDTTTTLVLKQPLMIKDIGWSHEDAIETRMRLHVFQADWEAPGMEAYDEL